MTFQAASRVRRVDDFEEMGQTPLKGWVIPAQAGIQSPCACCGLPARAGMTMIEISNVLTPGPPDALV